jgi:hypothetical protein
MLGEIDQDLVNKPSKILAVRARDSRDAQDRVNLGILGLKPVAVILMYNHPFVLGLWPQQLIDRLLEFFGNVTPRLLDRTDNTA